VRTAVMTARELAPSRFAKLFEMRNRVAYQLV
jgi:hypothetical protein